MDSRTVAGRPSDPPNQDELFARVRRELARDYDVHGELGRGGMAVVYRATELELLRPVALKVLPPELAASASLSERFRREARLAASFDHPNIIPIYRVGQAGGVFYIAMKFVEGRSLDDLMQAQGPLPIPVVLHVLRAAVRALAFAHQNAIIHRDIKGANILIDQDGRVVVSDFGIARAGEDAGLTGTGMLMGTPYFMSPEQCAGHRVGQQSDQYSLGVVAFQMLTGTVPFHAETIPGVMQHHFFTPVPDILAIRPDIPDALIAVVKRALAKRPAERFDTTREMQEAIEAIRFDEPIRTQGEALLRDLVLGVAVPKVSTGVLPPLQDTMLMTPPLMVKQRAAAGAKRERRRSLGAGAGAAVLLVGAVAYIALARSGPEDAIPLPQSTVTATDNVSGLADASPGAGGQGDGGEGATALAAQLAAAGKAGNTDTVTTAASPPARSVQAPLPVVDRSAAVTSAPPPVDAPPPVVGTGKLRVRVLPSDAEILVDGRVLGRGVVLDSLLPAGARRLQARAPGYRSLDTLITVLAGGTSQIGTLRLIPEGPP